MGVTNRPVRQHLGRGEIARRPRVVRRCSSAKFPGPVLGKAYTVSLTNAWWDCQDARTTGTASLLPIRPVCPLRVTVVHAIREGAPDVALWESVCPGSGRGGLRCGGARRPVHHRGGILLFKPLDRPTAQPRRAQPKVRGAPCPKSSSLCQARQVCLFTTETSSDGLSQSDGVLCERASASFKVLSAPSSGKGGGPASPHLTSPSVPGGPRVHLWDCFSTHLDRGEALPVRLRGLEGRQVDSVATASANPYVRQRSEPRHRAYASRPRSGFGFRKEFRRLLLDGSRRKSRARAFSRNADGVGHRPGRVVPFPPIRSTSVAARSVRRGS
jgi:hypothetical protein